MTLKVLLTEKKNVKVPWLLCFFTRWLIRGTVSNTRHTENNRLGRKINFPFDHMGTSKKLMHLCSGLSYYETLSVYTRLNSYMIACLFNSLVD